jgi:DNA modification methylase
MSQYKLFCADCLELLPKIKGDSIDAIVCDPPYELGFMGKKWDNSGITYNVKVWQQCLRILRPGGYLLAFGGTRTYHRLACAIEDAGLEIRDMIEWIYGSGFPKSLDVSKAIDKMAGAERTVVGTSPSGGFKRLMVHNAEAGFRPADYYPEGNKFTSKEAITDAARQWQGWGTALKPAHEPICVARKLLEGPVAENVLKHGTGGINVDACRVNKENGDRTEYGVNGIKRKTGNVWGKQYGEIKFDGTQGRWPANLIHDGSSEVMAMFGKAGEKISGSGKIKVSGGRKSGHGTWTQSAGMQKAGAENIGIRDFGDVGTAARFFYCAKASRAEREMGLEGFEAKQPDESRKEGNPGGDNPRNRGVKAVRNNHPTVKPIALMRYLCRLITPSGGIVLDPFVGSGSTGMAALLEGFKFVGIDKDEDYVKIAEARILSVEKEITK